VCVCAHASRASCRLSRCAQIMSVMPVVTIPASVSPEGVPTRVIDTSCRSPRSAFRVFCRADNGSNQLASRTLEWLMQS
jgi:hypothetical protein